MKDINPEFIEKIRNNQRLRQRVAFESPLWFSLLYLQHHFKYPFAPFHLEIFNLIEQKEYNLIVVMAFRESGKSAILNMVNVLWSVLGKPEKKFVIIISQTQEQAKSHFLNIKAELENNPLLKEDFGPFAENKDDLKRLSLELVYHEAKIISVTHEQSIRGMKYGPYRPDLIIGDDMEDISSNDSEALYNRFQTEIAPLGSTNTRIFILGNLLSSDSFMIKMKDAISDNKVKGLFRAYPLLDKNGLNLWKSKFPGAKETKKLRYKLSTEAWAREYLLTLGNPDYYAESKPEPPNPHDLYAGTEKFTRKYNSLIAAARKTYRSDLSYQELQIPIIKQMRKFKIIIPEAEEEGEIEPGDPRYEKYQQLQKEISKINNWYHDEFKQWIHRQWDKR